ncbi:MAG: hypothetical protein GY861_12050 [bacterium]|nr:hypothetical protein [bacterium]
MVKLNAKEYGTKKKWYPATDNGDILWGSPDVTEYIFKHKAKRPSKITTTDNTETPTKATTEKTTDKPKEKYSNRTPPSYTKHKFSPEIIAEVKNLNRDGKKGKEVASYYLSDYNKKVGKDYKNILELNTDALMQGLIDFIKKQPPKSL